MAITHRSEFTGTAGTLLNAAGYVPDQGAVWNDQGFFAVALDGAGNAVRINFADSSWSADSTTADGTLQCTMQHDDTGGAGTCEVWYHATATLTAGYTIALLPGTGGIELRRNASVVGSHSTGYTQSAANTIEIVVSGGGATHNVYVNGGGSPVITYTDGAPLGGGKLGIAIAGGSAAGVAKVSRVQWDAVVPTYPKNDNADPRRLVARSTRSRLLWV